MSGGQALVIPEWLALLVGRLTLELEAAKVELARLQSDSCSGQ